MDDFRHIDSGGDDTQYLCLSSWKELSNLYGFALLLTSLTICDQYQMIASWSKAGDWSAISDVTPSMSIILWIFVIGSFIVNVIPMLLSDYHNK